MQMSCYRCAGTGWTCDRHPDEPYRHDACLGERTACGLCTTARNRPGVLPRLPSVSGSPTSAVGGDPPHGMTAAVGDYEGLRDSFDYNTLWGLLARIERSHRLVRFSDVGHEPSHG